jgi:hypothetical protein
MYDKFSKLYSQRMILATNSSESSGCECDTFEIRYESTNFKGEESFETIAAWSVSIDSQISYLKCGATVSMWLRYDDANSRRDNFYLEKNF